MTIPSTQSISLGDISVELGRPRTTQIALGDPEVRTFLGIASGKVGLGQLRGQTFGRAVVSRIVSAHAMNLVINLNSLPGYVAGKSDITITVNSGIYLWSDSATPGLSITGGTVGDTVKLVNNGFIMGKGGNGYTYIPTPEEYRLPTVGEPALSTTFNLTIDTLNGYIGGGGGGGGGYLCGGGGAGGGLGGYYQGSSSPGAGGAIGAKGGNSSGAWGAGGGGGRIMPGANTARAVSVGLNNAQGIGGDAGAGGGNAYICWIYPGAGGGGWGAKGGDVAVAADSGNANFTLYAGYGGGAGNIGGSETMVGGVALAAAYPGAAGGKAIVTNGKTITYVGASASRVFGIVG